MKSTQMILPKHIDRGWLLFIATVAIGLVSLVGLILSGNRSERNTAPSNLASAIDAKSAALSFKPRSVELSSEMAVRVRNAINREDYSEADKIASDVFASSHIENWRFHPFAEFVNGIADLNDPKFEARLDAWVALNQNDAKPLLIRAQYLHDMGWLKRGHRFIRNTPTASLHEFQSYMNRALADIEAAIRLDDGNPYSFYLRLRILRGSDRSDKAANAFDDAIARYPGYYSLYEAMLSMLQPKWGGDVPAMYAFVDRYAGQSDERSPLRLLYLVLYRDLLETVSTSCGRYWPDSDKMAQCAISGMQKVVTPGLESNVVRALQLYDRSDKYQFGAALEAVLFGMLKMSGGGTYGGAMIELAASAMHSDTQLKESKPGHNNYVIDRVVAESWRLKGFYDNALQKDQEALGDIETTSFPSDEDRYLAVAGVYQHMAEIYSRLHQYADMIAYEQAAVAVGNKTEQEYFVCYGYYQLKDYDNAVRTCAKAIGDSPGVLQAHYWRGVAYRDKGEADAALRDLTIVADSQSDMRVSAAIDMSMIYFGRGDNRGALNVLNGYKYLYDPDASSKQNIAVSYNNRCYAYMQLGELKQALDDCTASLKYGNIPDAFHKQQELIKRLNAHEVEL